MRYRLVSLLAVLVLVIGHRAARAAPTWNDGAGAVVGTENCQQYAETLSTSFVGWFGDVSAPPQVGSTVYVHVWWGVSGNPCTGGAQVAPELFLPAGASLAISATNPVKCFALDIAHNTNSPDTVNCPQAPVRGLQGGLAFYPKTQATWPSARGYGWEIQVPITLTAPLAGLAGGSPCHDCLGAATWMIDGVNNPWAFPSTPMITSGNSSLIPTITYGTPANYNITDTSANGSLILDHVGLAGSLFVEEGPTPPASTATCTASSTPVTIAATQSDPVTYPSVMFSQISPGTTVYWRGCFQVGTTMYVGATQSFTTTGGPPKILSLSRTLAVTGDSVTIAGSRLTGATVRFTNTSGVATQISPSSITDSQIVFTVPSFSGSMTGTLQVSTAAGNAATAFAIGIDTIEDSLVMDALDGVSTQKNDVRLTFHATSPGANMTCTLDNAPTSQACSGGSIEYDNVPAGPHTITVSTVLGVFSDPTPLVASFTMADTTPPDTYLTAAPAATSSSTTATFGFASQDPTATFECLLDRARAWTRCTSPITYNLLAIGPHMFQVRARDAANNVDATPATYAFTVALVDTTITNGPAQHSFDPTPAFSFTGFNAVRFECNINNLGWAACVSGQKFGKLVPGGNVFQVRGIDAAGDVDPTPASYAWSYF